MSTLADHRARFWADCWMKVEQVEARAAKVGLTVYVHGFERGDRAWTFASANDALHWLDGYETAARAAEAMAMQGMLASHPRDMPYSKIVLGFEVNLGPDAPSGAEACIRMADTLLKALEQQP